MPYRFEAGETVEETFRRCATEQLDDAIEELTEGVKDDPVVAVHTARKALKKERSLLRLGTGSFDRAERSRRNDALREAGRRLSGVRDADVMIEALDEISQTFAGQLPQQTFTAIRANLAAVRDVTRARLADSGLTAEVARSLRSIRPAIGESQLRREGWSAIDAGLLRSYRRGRQALGRAGREPTAENLHEWRKRVKDLWYHLRLLAPISPQTLKGQAKQAHRLSDVLGDDHDLAILRQLLIETGEQIPVDLVPVLALIDLRREQLQQDALFLGARVYAEAPKEFRRRLHRYWKAWRAETRAAATQRPARVAERSRAAAIA
jgi:CHAD domain-containing protein